ncbi:hypothetical protein F8388_015156 [Cannabis sativa]|uniref:Uncharacterized protein n=2 Tax=Cannabis sativa TaxID=3483 RepID=A0A7J6EQX5_CANSA|nr:hypothetical protein F8388_015156 [Cannabis sativa]KAF4395399.1 hypothetical protein G4B88_010863 [Cannabis sativa]
MTTKRFRDDSAESELDSFEVKKLREEFLGFLDDSDPDPSTQDLASVMKSLEEEISAPSCSVTPTPAPVVDLASESGESQPDLGYLLEASDDELGLPPSNSGEDVLKEEETELVRVESGSSGIGEFLGFDEQVPSYDSFEFGTGDNFNESNDFLPFDGLFGFSDVYYDSADFSDLSWRSETMPAAQ